MLKDNRIFIILGMHRSGTSAVAGLLHNGGVSMGEKFRKPLPENPTGFFEEESFRQLNDAILMKEGYVVKEWNTEFNGITIHPTTLERAAEIIHHFNTAFSTWGWKDPRTCLTLSFWLRVLDRSYLLPNTNIIIVSRSIKSVSHSLFMRGNITDVHRGEKLYEMYHQYLNNALLAYQDRVRVLKISYEQLIIGNDISRLEDFCNLKLNRDFIDISLNHAD